MNAWSLFLLVFSWRLAMTTPAVNAGSETYNHHRPKPFAKKQPKKKGETIKHKSSKEHGAPKRPLVKDSHLLNPPKLTSFPTFSPALQETSAPSRACNQYECCTDADCGDAQSYECRQNACLLRECDISLEAIECCVNTDCLEANEICEESVCIKTGNPRFTLSWFGNDDLDLHVITPGGVDIYWNNTLDTISGGFLDKDDIPDITQRWVENIVFDVNAPTGTYTYFVLGFNILEAPDNFELSVWEGNTQVAFETGGGLQFQEESTRYFYTKN